MTCDLRWLSSDCVGCFVASSRRIDSTVTTFCPVMQHHIPICEAGHYEELFLRRLRLFQGFSFWRTFIPSMQIECLSGRILMGAFLLRSQSCFGSLNPDLIRHLALQLRDFGPVSRGSGWSCVYRPSIATSIQNVPIRLQDFIVLCMYVFDRDQR